MSVADDPDIWAKSLDDQLLLWIDVGEPAFERIKKASHQAKQVKVYSFNSKSDVWWKQSQSDFANIQVDVNQFQFAQMQALAKLVKRSMDFSVTITGDSAYVAAELGECEVTCLSLQGEK